MPRRDHRKTTKGVLVKCYCGRTFNVTDPSTRFIACARCGFLMEKIEVPGGLLLAAKYHLAVSLRER